MATLSEYQMFLEKEYNRLYVDMVISLLAVVEQGDLSEGEVFRRIYELENLMETRKYAIQSVMTNAMREKFLKTKIETQTYLTEQIGSHSVTAKLTTLNHPALDSLLREKKDVINRQFGAMVRDLKNDFNSLDKFMTLINGSRDVEGSQYRIGRRIVDDLRQIGIRNIEQGLLTGRAWNKTERVIFQDLKKLGQTGQINIGEPTAFVRYLGKKKIVDFPVRIKAFEKLDDPDNFYFHLRTRNGKLQWFEAKSYSNLVAITTEREASWLGEIEGSVSIGNYLVGFNFFGKNYVKDADPCSKIDGQIFSLKKGFVAKNGKIYPYLFDSLPQKPYLLPHPRCRHTMGAVIDNLRVLEKYDLIAARNKFGIKPGEEKAA